MDEDQNQIEGLPPGAVVKPLTPQIEGLPPGAVVRPIGQQNVAGLPAGAVVKPSPAPATAPPVATPMAAPAPVRSPMAITQQGVQQPANLLHLGSQLPPEQTGPLPSTRVQQQFTPPPPRSLADEVLERTSGPGLQLVPALKPAAPPVTREQQLQQQAQQIQAGKTLAPEENAPLAQPATPRELAQKTPIRYTQETLPQDIRQQGEYGQDIKATREEGAARFMRDINTPLLPALSKAVEELVPLTDPKKNPKAAEQMEQAKQFAKKHPTLAGIEEGLERTAEGQSTISNGALLAFLPSSKVMSMIFSAQAAQGSFKSAQEAYHEYKAGRNKEAAAAATEALINAGFAGLAGLHAASGKAHTAPTEEGGTAPPPPPGGVPAEAAQAANEVAAHPAMAPAMDAPVQSTKVGTVDKTSDRDVLQPTNNPAVNQGLATEAMPEYVAGIKSALKGIPGAELANTRDSKNPERLAEKINEEGQPAQTVNDYGAAQISVDSPAAKDATIAAIKKQFPVVREEDLFEKGDPDYGFRHVSLQVEMPNGVTQELQVVPREVLEANPEEHHDYKRGRNAELEGKDQEFEKAAATAKEKNDAAMAAFNERNNQTTTQKGVRETPSEQPQKEASPASEAALFAKGDRVRLADGRTGQIAYFEPVSQRARIRLDDGRQIPAVKAKDLSHEEIISEQRPATTEADVRPIEDRAQEEARPIEAQRSASDQEASAERVRPQPEQEVANANQAIEPNPNRGGERPASEGRAEAEANAGVSEAARGAAEPAQGERGRPAPEGVGTQERTRAVIDKLKAKQREKVGVASDLEAAPSRAVEKQEAAIAPGDVGRVPISELAVDPQRFQYKLNTDESGATNKLKDVTWNDALSGIVTAWKDPKDGKTYVVNGHHRYDLARRHGVKDLAVRMLPEDVKSAEEARVVGALQNIAEGNGTSIDAAKFMRDTGYTPAELERYGISLSGSVADGGTSLARLDQKLFDDVVAGRIPERRGIAIGRAAETPAQQEALVRLIDKAEKRGKSVTNATIEELGRMVRSAGEHTSTQESLFGAQERTESLALEKAEVSSYIRDQIGREKRLFGGLASESKAKTLAESGNNKIDAKGNSGIAKRAEQAQEVYDRLSTRTGPVNDLLERAAKRIAEGENASTVKSDAYRDIREALSDSIRRGSEETGKRGEDNAAGPEAAEQRPSKEELESAGQRSLMRRRENESLKELTTRFEKRGVDAVVSESGDGITLSKVVVPKADRGKGIGTEFMDALTDYADANGKTIALTPDDTFGGSKGRLKDFYKRFGFKDNAGRSKDFRFRETMIREPKQSSLERQSDSPWYLKSERLIEQKMRGPMKGGDVLRMLQNGGVKADELKWTGLNELLQGKERVTPEEVRQHLAEGGLKIEEVTKGGDIPKGQYLVFDKDDNIVGAEATEEAARKAAAAQEGSWADRDDPAGRHAIANAVQAPKYQTYQLPGGQNYREMLLIGPDSADRAPAGSRAAMGLEPGQDYHSGHWDEPNILAHVRFNDRTTPDGKRLLHVEEIQSDWHQQGRDKGYKAANEAETREQLTPPANAALKKLDWLGFDSPAQARGAVLDHPDWASRWDVVGDLTEAEIAAVDAWRDATETKERVPDAPFKKDWHEMAFRRMVRYAAEHGYDGLSWTPGEKQAERYDLSKQVEAIRANKNPDGTYQLGIKQPGKNMAPYNTEVPASELADHVGKELAHRIVAEVTEPGVEKGKVFSGLDLKVGGKGMTGFYDKIIPDYARKFGKQWGAKVGEANISKELSSSHPWVVRDMESGAVKNRFETEDEADQYIEAMSDGGPGNLVAAREDTAQKVPYLDITPDMRKSVMEEGVAMFRRPTLPRMAPERLARYAELANPELVPARGKNAPMVLLDDVSHQLLNEVNPDISYGIEGVALSGRDVGVTMDRLEEMAKQYERDGNKASAAKVRALAGMLKDAAGSSGEVVALSAAPSSQRFAGEEQFHAWQLRHGGDAGDAILSVGQNPAVAKARESLIGQGYDGSVSTAVLEATARTFNGDWSSVGIGEEEAASLLTEYLDKMVELRGKDVLNDLPEEFSRTIEDANERAQANGQELDAGRSRAVSEQPTREEAPDLTQRGQRENGSERLPFGEDAGGAAEERAAGAARDTGETGRQGSLFRQEVAESEKKDEPQPLEKLVSGLAEIPSKKLSPVDRVKQGMLRSTEYIRGTAPRINKAIAGIKGAAAGMWDAYRRPPAWTDFKDMTGKFDYAIQLADRDLQELTHELKRLVPDKERRTAMTNYLEAAGNMDILRDRASMTEDPKLKRGYELAMDLTPEEKSIVAQTRQYFESQLDEAVKAGLLEQGASDYITHIHEKDVRGFQSLINFGELAPNPAFIKKRVFSSYFDGEQMGFKPKDKDFGFLTAAYHKAFVNALASRAYIRSLIDGKAKDGRPLAVMASRGKIGEIPKDEAPYVIERGKQRPDEVADYQTVDHPALRNWKYDLTQDEADIIDPKLWEDETKSLAVTGDLLLHPEIAQHVRNNLGRSMISANPVGRTAMKVSSTLKQSLLAGIPSGFHQAQETIHAMEHKVNPFRLVELNLRDKKQADLASHGLKVAAFDSQSAFADASDSFLRAVPVLGDVSHAYQNYLFHDYIPRIKMTMALHALDRNTKRYQGKLSHDQILELTANQANAAFGELNYRMMGRNKTIQDIFRLTALAPDFLEARAKFVGQALKPFGQEQRSALLRGAAVMYVGARILNAVMNNGETYADDPEMAFKVKVGQKAYGLRTVQGDILNLVANPRTFAYNRMNPMTVRPFVEFVTGRDSFGRQKSASSQLKDMAKSAAPIPLQGWIQNNGQTWADSILNSVGLQGGKYRTPAETLARKNHLKNIPDTPEDPEKMAEMRKHRQMEDDLRNGHMSTKDLWAEVSKGHLRPHDAGAIQKRAMHSELENSLANNSIEQALDVYEKASASERKVILPIVRQKIANMQRLPSQREKIMARLDKLTQQDQLREKMMATTR